MTRTTTTTTPRATNAPSQAVLELRDLAHTAPSEASEQAWELLGHYGRRRDLGALSSVFDQGDLPPRDLSGSGDHDLVVTCVHPLVDLPLRGVVAHLPRPLLWLGKSFDPIAGRGVNEFHRSLGPALRLLAPFGHWETGPRGLQGLGFDTYVEAGAIEPSPRVLVIDYPIPGRAIRDEMVEVCPGVYLGRALLRLPTDHYINAAYWRLRTAPSNGSDT